MIKLFWYKSKNFGDRLSPEILSWVTGERVEYARVEDSDIVSIGSIMHFIPGEYDGVIWGTGVIKNRDHHFQYADIQAVRGLITHRLCNARAPIGDPGILVSRMYCDTVFPLHPLGIVLHNSEREQDIPAWLRKNALIISPIGEPQTVIHRVRSCSCILSSSLHGLIVAEAFGIPNAHCKFNARPDHLKYSDWYTSLGIVPLVIEPEVEGSAESIMLKVSRGWTRKPIRCMQDALVRHLNIDHLR